MSLLKKTLIFTLIISLLVIILFNFIFIISDNTIIKDKFYETVILNSNIAYDIHEDIHTYIEKNLMLEINNNIKTNNIPNQYEILFDLGAENLIHPINNSLTTDWISSQLIIASEDFIDFLKGNNDFNISISLNEQHLILEEELNSFINSLSLEQKELLGFNGESNNLYYDLVDYFNIPYSIDITEYLMEYNSVNIITEYSHIIGYIINQNFIYFLFLYLILFLIFLILSDLKFSMNIFALSFISLGLFILLFNKIPLSKININASESIQTLINTSIHLVRSEIMHTSLFFIFTGLIIFIFNQSYQKLKIKYLTKKIPSN